MPGAALVGCGPRVHQPGEESLREASAAPGGSAGAVQPWQAGADCTPSAIHLSSLTSKLVLLHWASGPHCSERCCCEVHFAVGCVCVCLCLCLCACMQTDREGKPIGAALSSGGNSSPCLHVERGRACRRCVHQWGKDFWS